ncbi:MAG: hypothetical protein Unbinned5434contig1000_32 [Prokaryotic dsDNA virus sp.]|jgi:predicted DNA-binding protein YlxM (UPF0122 family)|nr:MAG: hypothetical protein Unbinned5434contig1000_32 [Prokaryotic dsDNA virus sp.]|tara:strand:- start:1998 stop:2255 length:258 start_codon:yes stop_codon:yes gene_type:complete
MFKNSITSENTPESHKEVIINQIENQLNLASDDETSNEDLDILKNHFKWVLANDFYKDELTSEQISEMESYLPNDYSNDFIDLPQ